MSHTMHLGWTHALPIHAPTAPRWFTTVERAVAQARTWLVAEHTASPVYETHVGYIENALMAREMYRL